MAERTDATASVSEEQIKHLVNRFLCYPFPSDLNPDGGISYRRSETSIKFNHPGPVGTNLLTADQAEAMVRYMVEGMANADLSVLRRLY